MPKYLYSFADIDMVAVRLAKEAFGMNQIDREVMAILTLATK